MLWRIGNGQKVKVWGDKWLPTPTTFTVQSSPKSIPAESMVSALIDPDTLWWNHNLVETIFSPEEAQIIKTIYSN
jgi:hypothetical protein